MGQDSGVSLSLILGLLLVSAVGLLILGVILGGIGFLIGF